MEKRLTAVQELALTRNAFARGASPMLRDRLVRLLMLDEAFDEVIEMLAPCGDLGFGEEGMLAQAFLAKENAADSERARLAAARAFALARNDAERASALATRGKAETRLGDTAAARRTLLQALGFDPDNKDACKRIAAIDLIAGRPDAALAVSGELVAQGTAHARLFAAKALAQARAGDIAAARETVGLDSLQVAERLAPPPGWDSIEAFNAALAKELLGHPGIRYERYGSASELTWRIEALARADTPLVRLLLAQIIAAIGRHCDRAGAIDHPWAKAKPTEAVLRNWCVITESTGFETWHVHQFGWLSGVYYVQVPDAIAQGTGREGCLAFGLPDELAGAEGSALFGEHLVRPQQGLLLTFPSHVYHRTYPHGCGEKRICVAFDLRPA